MPATVVLTSKSEFDHPPTNRVVVKNDILLLLILRLVGLSVQMVENGLVVILKIYKKLGIQIYKFNYYLEKGPGARNC